MSNLGTNKYNLSIEKIQNWLNSGLLVREISEKLGCSKRHIYNFIKKNKISLPEDNLIGIKFNDLEVIEKGPFKERQYWICRCKCGNILKVSTSGVKKHRVQTCGCWFKKPAKDKKHYKGYEDITGKYWYQLQQSAKSRKIKLLVSLEEIWNLYIKQNKKCALSGVDIDFALSVKNYTTEQTASLDRIDSYEDYTIDNVQWIHKHLQKIKNSMQDNIFKEWCRLVVYNNQNSIEYII